MKISKLFHWLYATLMFLPLIFFVPSAFYYGLNEHASNTETTTINYKYESNEVNSLSDLVEGNIYYLDTFDLSNLYLVDDFYLYVLSSSNTDLFESYTEYEGNKFDSQDCIIYLTTTDYQNNVWNVSLYLIENESTTLYFEYSNALILQNCIFICNQNVIDYFEFNSNLNLPQYTDYNVIESVSVNNDDTITNKMYLAWVSLWDLPVFSWTKTCFLSAGFTYISGLFGVSATNSLNYVFGYWITISICWLVFDLLIYVPNLAHRWLDKGAIE